MASLGGRGCERCRGPVCAEPHPATSIAGARLACTPTSRGRSRVRGHVRPASRRTAEIDLRPSSEAPPPPARFSSVGHEAYPAPSAHRHVRTLLSIDTSTPPSASAAGPPPSRAAGRRQRSAAGLPTAEGPRPQPPSSCVGVSRKCLGHTLHQDLQCGLTDAIGAAGGHQFPAAVALRDGLHEKLHGR